MQGKFCLVKSASLLQLKRLFFKVFSGQKIGRKKAKNICYSQWGKTLQFSGNSNSSIFIILGDFGNFSQKLVKIGKI